ncbi:MAG: insulinase family protein, partial [Saprospiraceae bacterium]|nr:insulinase family protein [Saprospiraceae bacterium]
NRAELRLVVKVGSLQEDPDQLGVAHFVEHMAFNGSEHFSKNELVDYLESVGTRFGPDLNAYTSFDETVYMLQVRTDDSLQLAKGLLVLHDWAGGLSFDDEEIDKERGVVESEWRTGLSAGQRMQQEYLPVLFKDSRYAERLPIGKPEIIETIPYDRVRQFYRDWYRPNEMAVVVVGNVDVDVMEKTINDQFGALKNPSPERERERYKVPMFGENLVSICSDKEATNTAVQLLYRHPETPTRSEADFQQALTNSLYNSMLNNRLSELSQKAEPPFIFAYSGYSSGLGHVSNYSSYALVPEGGIEKGLSAVLKENQRVLQHGFTDSELERGKTEIVKAAERLARERDKQESGNLASDLVGYFTDGGPLLSPDQYYALVGKLIPGIPLDSVNVLADRWITKDNRILIITAPRKDGSPLPTETAMLHLIDSVSNLTVEPYIDEVSAEPLFSEDLVPVPITDKKTFDDTGIMEWTLANGIRVFAKPTTYKNDEIQMSAYSDGGTSLYDDQKFLQARFASSIINQSGLGPFTEVQLEKLLTGKRVSVVPTIGSESEGFSGSASPEDLEVLFQLTYLYFKNPRKDEEAFASYLSKQKAFIENLDANPNFFFYDQTTRVKYNNHPRTGYPTVEELNRLNLDSIFAIYEDRFANAGDFTFYFVGNFDPETLQMLTREYLGNLPNTGRKEHWKDRGIELVNGTIDKSWERGEAPKTSVQIVYHGPIEWDDNVRYRFSSMVDLMRIKLRESMREDKGGVYGVSLSGNTSRDPKPEYSLTISFNCDPPRTQELINTASETIRQVAEEGVSEEDLQKVTETQKQTRIKSMEQNRYWLNGIEDCDYYSKPFSKLLLPALESKIESLTTKDLQDAAAKYFNSANRMQFVMKPEGEAN